MEPPSYNVAVSLPTYDESLRSKQEEDEQQLCEPSASLEVSVVVLFVLNLRYSVLIQFAVFF